MDGATVGSTNTQTQAFQLLKENKITFQNGTIIADNNDVQMMIQNYSDLTLNNMVLDATQGTNSISYVLSTNNGSTTINNTTITAKNGGIAFDACSGWGNYTSNTVEVTGNSVINGDIEVSYYGQAGTTPAALTLTSGTLNGSIVMEQGAEQATITKNNNFVATAPEGYEWEDNGDGTSTLVVPMSEQDIVLTDGQPYTIATDTQVKSATYVRTVNTANVFCAWYVPFDYTITSEDAENLTFYRINMIANAPEVEEEVGEVQNTEKIWVYLSKMEAGDKLTANRPYMFKSSTTGELTFTTEGATLKAPATDPRLENSTTAYKYEFYGTYETIGLQAEENAYSYYVNTKGQISKPKNKVIDLGSYRWYIHATKKAGGPNYVPVFDFTEDIDDATGISNKVGIQMAESYYNLNGMRISKPASGAYIIKYSDGSVKKVAVK